MAKSTAVRSSDRLLEARKCFLLHGWDFKILTLLKVLSLQRSTNNVYKIFKLGYSKIYSIVHHFAKSFKCLCWDIEQQNLRTGNICWPVKLIRLISSHNENVTLINHNNFSFADFLVKDLKARPLEPFKIIKSMLVKFRKIEKLLWYCLPLSMRPCSTCTLWFIHLFEVRVFLIRKLKQVG